MQASLLSPSLFFSLIRPPPRFTLFPYTTLFRSGPGRAQRLPRIVQVLLGAAEVRRLMCHLRDKGGDPVGDRKSTRLNSSHRCISYAVFCLKKKIWTEAPSPNLHLSYPLPIRSRS